MLKKFQAFLINVVIIEGRHYVWPNIDSMVTVKVQNQKKTTNIKSHTDCPFYNEHFVFEFSSTLEDLLDVNITITVIKPGSIIRKRKILGYITFDVGTVWYQQNHQFYHKWAILSAPRKESVGGTRGYLKLDVSILSKGETPKIPRSFNTEEIEGNLLLPKGHTTDRQRIIFMIDIYRGVEFIKKHLQDSILKKPEVPPSIFVQVSFAGITMRSTVVKNTSSPTWGERLILPELFPPLCQRFKFELFYNETTKRATRFLTLRDIANDKEEGFLPTFGPAYLHFYSPNHLEGYLGKVLLALETKWIGSTIEPEPHLAINEAPIINEELLLKYENVTLFAAIFDVSLIDKKYSDKTISFRLACGPCQRETEEYENKFASTVTVPIKPIPINKSYSFLPIEGRKPCLDMTLVLPDTTKRMYNYNLLYKILLDFKSRLDKIENLFLTKDYRIASVEAEDLLLETVDFICSNCNKYIDIVSTYNYDEDLNLDQQRQKMCLKEMEKIIFLAKSTNVHGSKKRVFQKLEKLYIKLECLIDNVESWPLIYLWMNYGNKRVAYHIIKPENIVYSVVDEEKGIHCGVLQSIFFQTEENVHNVPEFVTTVCQMNVILWMGLERHWNDFLNNLPPGFSFSANIVPKILLAGEKHEFQCKAHIFQGRLSPGSDKNSLCDPYTQVILNGQCRQTQIIKKTLNPVWDETLHFKKIDLYGSIEFILENPPSVCFDIYDKDEFCKFEIVGRCLVKPIIKPCDDIYPPPTLKLSYHQVRNKIHTKNEILAAVELLELAPGDVIEDDKVIRKIPQDIKPNLINHRIDVVFWGIRELKPGQLKHLHKVKMVVECVNISFKSEIIPNTKKYANFPEHVKIFEAVFPQEEEYAPALFLKLLECRLFGTTILSGVHITPMQLFFLQPMTSYEREKRIFQERIQSVYRMRSSMNEILKSVEVVDQNKEIQIQEKQIKKKGKFGLCGPKKNKVEKLSHFMEGELLTEDEDFNWWTKFYASFEQVSSDEKPSTSKKHKLKIYRNELEFQPEFQNFTDLLQNFPLYKGKRTGDETVDEENTVGVFKGSLKIYPWPTSGDYVTASGLPLELGFFQDFPSNNPVRFVLRVYCVRALGLRPKDANGKSDPYLYLTLTNQIINDKDNTVMEQLNPIFGRCFELNGIFPQDHKLVVAVYDWDVTSSDDLIGQTEIDLENRFYTKHRGHCGLPENYVNSGYCQWRDQQRPSVILENLCKKYNISSPKYTTTSVCVAYKEFAPQNFTPSDNIDFDRQVLALDVLKRWEEIPVVGCVLVPEHVETRSLYNPAKPGIEQGKLQLWIDILPCADLPTPPAVNITPTKAVPYELRVIVWNTDNIKLDEVDMITGEKKSDIFVKGWVVRPENAQYTDVHYRSLTGEGNFNWRFIFSFDYLSNENKIVLREKSMFKYDVTETKIPCRLYLQVWDNDTFSSHDFLGSLSLDISKLPRGAKLAKNCSLDVLCVDSPGLNLFKVKRTRGWWPLKDVDLVKQQDIFAGSIELEFELLTKEEAVKNPAGLGRDEPQPLPKPNRPETSFAWFWSPFKALKYVLKGNKWKIIKCTLFLLLIVFLVVGFFAIPDNAIQSIFHL